MRWQPPVWGCLVASVAPRCTGAFLAPEPKSLQRGRKGGCGWSRTSGRVCIPYKKLQKQKFTRSKSPANLSKATWAIYYVEKKQKPAIIRFPQKCQKSLTFSTGCHSHTIFLACFSLVFTAKKVISSKVTVSWSVYWFAVSFLVWSYIFTINRPQWASEVSSYFPFRIAYWLIV